MIVKQKRKYKVSVITLLVLSLTTALFAGCGGKSASNSAGSGAGQNSTEVEIQNVSYDPTREFYEAYNKAFAAHWLKEAGQKVTVKQSHGGSGKQARSVIDGQQADIVTLALAYDINAIQKKGLLKQDWQNSFDDNSAPYYSTIVFLVRKGNPKQIKDWNDLIREDVSVITPNPKTSGGARWNYLAAWGYALKHNNNDEAAAQQFVQFLFKRVEVLDSGARGSTTTFVERSIGDVLISWENEAFLAVNELGKDQFDIIVPSLSILAEPPVAVVDSIVDKRGTRKVAEAYLKYLYTKEAQELAAKHHYRPRLEEVAKQHESTFPSIELLTIDKDFGGWEAAQAKHFADGGIFDQIYAK